MDNNQRDRQQAMQTAFGKLGEMLRSGIPLPQATAAAGEECKDLEVAKAFATVHARAERQENVSDVLSEFGDLFPKSIQLMWKAGCSGSAGQDHLPECCRRIAALLAEADGQGATDAVAGPAADLIEEIVAIAVKDRASDLHIEPMTSDVKVRYRVDGVLYEMKPISRDEGNAVVEQIMQMCKMDLSQKEKPQDGRIMLDVEGRTVDIRINVSPVIHGNVVAMRLLDRAEVSLSLDNLCMEPDQLELYKAQVHAPQGTILVVGPSGCGKTTTIYGSLTELNDTSRKIMTVEDPVEFALEGIDQMSVRQEAGLGFEQALRSILRQAPNVIMAGEIRDAGVANLVVQASLTGHVVFSTLHTNDCAGTFMRLINMGVKSWLVADSVRCVVAQRLVREICEDCKVEHKPEQGEFESLQLTDAERDLPIYRGEGCEKCNQIGYKGRGAIYSIMPMTPAVARQVEKKDVEAIESAARAEGWTSLREAAIRKMFRGETTVEEVLKFT